MYRLEKAAWLSLGLLALLGCRDVILDGGIQLGLVVVGIVSSPQSTPVVDAVVTVQFPDPVEPVTTIRRTGANGEYSTGFFPLLGSPGPRILTITIEPPASSSLRDTVLMVQADLTRPPDTARFDVMLSP